VDVLEADVSLSDDEELSLPQPAANAPISATATMLVAHFLVTFMSLLMGLVGQALATAASPR
jgi:hypothetical protein